MVDPFNLEDFWVWNEEDNCLILSSFERAINQKKDSKAPLSVSSTMNFSTISAAAGCPHAHLLLRFRDFLPFKEQLIFKKYIQRRPKLNENHCVTIRDIKDVVVYQCLATIPIDCLELFYTRKTDRFLRALTFYFAKYLEVFELLCERSERAVTQLRYPGTLRTEQRLRVALGNRRAMVAREYFAILQSLALPNGQHLAQLERDTRQFEVLYCLSSRFVYIALNRRFANLIEVEVNRMFRTEAFNMAKRRKSFMYRDATDTSVLNDFPMIERRTLARSPASVQLVNVQIQNYKLLGVGNVPWEVSSLDELELIYILPEELLRENGIKLGNLGLPRDQFDIMLMPKPKGIEEKEEEKFFPMKITETSIGSIEVTSLIESFLEGGEEEREAFEEEKELKSEFYFPIGDGPFDKEDLEPDTQNLLARKAWYNYRKNKMKIEEERNPIV